MGSVFSTIERKTCRWLLVLLLLGAFCLPAPPAAATGKIISYPPDPPTATAPVPARASLRPAWENLLAACNQRDLRQIDASFELLRQAKKQLRFANASRFSLALLALAEQAVRNNDSTGAASLIGKAILLSPDFSFPRQALGALQFRQRRFLASLGSWLRGVQIAVSKNHLERLKILALLLLLAALLPIWQLAFFLVAALCRYFYALRDELEQKFGLAAALGLIIIGLLLLVILLWRSLFLLPALALLAAVLAPMFNRRERLTLYVLAGLLLLAPLSYSLGMQLGRGLGDHFIREVLRINFDSFAPDKLQAVWEPQNTKARKQLQLFSQAAVFSRAGEYAQAISTMEELARFDPQAPAAVYNNLGNLYFHQNLLDRAISHYKEAIRRNPKSGIYHFNLNHAYIKKSFALAASESAFIQAWRLSPNLIKEQLAREQAGEGLTLINETLPWSYLFQGVTGNRLDHDLLRDYCRLFASPWAGSWLYCFSLLSLAAALSFAWYRHTDTSHFCSLCGTRFYGMRRLFVACPSCLHLSRQKTGDMFTERQKKKLRLYHRLVDRVLLSAGFLIPGTFQVAVGETVKGVLMLAGSFLLAAFFYCRWQGLLVAGIFPPGSPWTTMVFPLVLVILLLVANLQSWRRRRQQKMVVAHCF